MAENDEYFNYLKQRSRLGLLYRKFLLYPKLIKYLRGEVLDVGCGIGDMLRFRPGTIGADINPLTIDWLKSQGLNAYLMESDKLPFRDAGFDSVVLDNVLEHIADPTVLLSEIKRVLRPSGWLLLGVPGERGYASDDDHKVFYGQDLLTSVISAAGFRPITFFYTPFRSRWLDVNVRQYCLYGVFEAEPK